MADAQQVFLDVSDQTSPTVRVRACVIFNPAAKGEKAERFRRQLGTIGAESALRETRAAGDARRLAAQAVAEGFDTVVAAGGDGTVNEVLNGIGDAPGGFDRARLGVLPLGTVNVFARELGIPFAVEAAWNAVRAGRSTTIDLPRVEFSGAAGRETRLFAQLAGAGLDSRAVELVHWPLKKRIGPLAYVWAGIRAVAQKQATITVTDGEHTATGELVLVGNGRLYGGAFRVFPEADLNDGLLEICVFPRTNWFTLARYGPGLLLNRTLPPKATINFRARSFTLVSEERVGVEADGEWIGRLPATFSMSSSPLRVVVP